MNKYAFAFDVGGLFIKAAVLLESGHIIPGSYAIYPSHSKGTKEEIVAHLILILKQQAGLILDRQYEFYGVGYAFPGPFDYEKGICYIQGQDKFEHLYGVNLCSEVMSELRADPYFSSRLTSDFQIVFENDANLFALGELFSGKASSFSRSICMTIGTGTGSAFIDDGKLISDRSDVPMNGWIYNEPFADSVIDDYISKRGILRLAKELGMNTEHLEVKELAEKAYGGHRLAKQAFHRFGQNIGSIVNLFIASFKPETVIIGGQIAISKDLFLQGILEVLTDKNVLIQTVEGTSMSTFVGVASLLQRTSQKKKFLNDEC